MLERIFLLDGDGVALLPGRYDPWLVLLSVTVAICAATLALQLVDLARASPPKQRRIALLAGSTALGVGIWAMHFIAMLALDLCTPVRYAPGITALSMLPSIAASWVALNQLARESFQPRALLLAGTLVGAGIGTMHYSGMAAMQMAPLLRYDPATFGLSIVVAVGLATLALWVRFGLKRLAPLPALLGAGTLLGLAVTAMHYTGMAAARFIGSVDPGYDAAQHHQWTLALAIALAALFISGFASGVNALLRYRHLHAQLVRNEARVRAIVDTAVDAIISIDAHGRILSFNRAGETLFGWTAAEVAGRNISMLMPSPYREGHDGYLAAYLKGGAPTVIGAGREVTGLHRDGSTLPLRLAVGRVDIDDSTIFVGFVSDLRQRRAIEDALRASEQQYRGLMGNIPGVTFRCRFAADWPMIVLSDAVEALTGWPAIDYLQQRRSFADAIHPDDAGAVWEQVSAALGAHRPYDVEYRVVHRDGSERWVSEHGGGAFDDDGRLQWIDGVILDITETKLRNAEFVGIVDAVSRAMGMIEFELDGRIRHANHNFLALTGYRLDELVGQHHDLLCDEAERASPALGEQWDALRRGHFVAGEYRRLGKDGRAIWVQASYNPIFDADARPIKIISFVTDLSARRAMEQDLREAKERAEQAATARSRFLATMSHEIRTPMNAIIGFSDLLHDGPLQAEQRRHVDVVRHAARSLLTLVNDILDTAKLEGGAVALEQHAFSLPQLLEQLFSSLGVGAAAKGIDLRRDYPDSVPPYYLGDALRLQQVLINLVGNAIKFTERGSVTVRVRRHGETLCIEVADTGIGIAAERLPHIFDPFVQADASTTRRFGGTGLGTTIARQLVELMGGGIDVSSAPGEGSVFRVQLPLPVADAPEAADAAPYLGTALPPLTILVADDVAQNLELLATVLRRDGHVAHCVADGAEALAAVQSQPYDLVLMDVHMPVMDGLAAARAIRDHERASGSAAVPIIALTASVLAEDRAAATDAGMNGFATKPVELPVLYAEIARVLGIVETPVAPSRSPAVASSGAINWRRGIGLWGDRERLQDAIRRFLADELPRWTTDAVHVDTDWPARRARAHTLRGTAGNLALDGIARAAVHLESAAREADLDAFLAAGAALRDELAGAATALGGLATASGPSRPTEVAQDPALALTLIADAEQALGRGELAETPLAALAEALPAGRLAAVQRAIAEFDSAAAIQALHALRDTLAPDPADPPP